VTFPADIRTRWSASEVEDDQEWNGRGYETDISRREGRERRKDGREGKPVQWTKDRSIQSEAPTASQTYNEPEEHNHPSEWHDMWYKSILPERQKDVVTSKSDSNKVFWLENSLRAKVKKQQQQEKGKILEKHETYIPCIVVLRSALWLLYLILSSTANMWKSPDIWQNRTSRSDDVWSKGGVCAG